MGLNWYPRYTGDYGRDTGHLSLAEHGAYNVLLDHYYSTGRPLPKDYNGLYRLCSAMDPAEQSAVRSVADAYFPVDDDDDLRHNERADRELVRMTEHRERLAKAGRKGGLSKGKARLKRGLKGGLSEASSEAEAYPSPSPYPYPEPQPEKNTDSSERLQHSKPEPGVIAIPLVSKKDGPVKEYPVTQSQIDEWTELYPAVDIIQTLREIRGWNLSNPSRRKTQRGVLKHINGWLQKEQNGGR